MKGDTVSLEKQVLDVPFAPTLKDILYSTLVQIYERVGCEPNYEMGRLDDGLEIGDGTIGPRGEQGIFRAVYWYVTNRNTGPLLEINPFVPKEKPEAAKDCLTRFSQMESAEKGAPHRQFTRELKEGDFQEITNRVLLKHGEYLRARGL